MLEPTSCPRTAARTAALTIVMASGNSLCLSMVTRKSNTISLFFLEFSLDFCREMIPAILLLLIPEHYAHNDLLYFTRDSPITKKRGVGLDALTLNRKRRVSPVARGLLPFAAGNDNETAVHRRIKRLSLSLSFSFNRAVLVALPRQVYSEKLDRVLLRFAASLPLSTVRRPPPSAPSRRTKEFSSSSSFTSRARPGALKP